MAKAKKKSKGFLSRAASLLGSIPAVGNVRNAAKKVGKAKKTIKKTVKKATKTAKRVVKSTKKNVKKSVKKKKKTAAKLKKGLKKAKKKAKRKVKKKLPKKVGKVFTKARKLKNNLSKNKRVKKLKKQMKKTVLKAKKSVKKVKKTVNKASKTIKKTVAIAKVAGKGMVLAAKDKEAVKQVAITVSTTLASIVTDFIPVVGNIKSVYEVSYGVDPFTREKLDTTDRSLSAASIILGPFGKIVKRGNDGIKFVDKAIDTAKETAAVLEKSKTPPPKKDKVPAKGTKKVEVPYGEHITKDGNKKVLQQNVRYKTAEGYSYETNEFGHINSVEADLQLGKGKRNPYAQSNVGGTDRIRGKYLERDDGGHLIGSQFKGPGGIDNLVPMNSQINEAGGVWHQMEQEWASALEKGGTVNVKIKAQYTGDSARPDSFIVDYSIDGGRTQKVTIQNQIGG